MLLADHQLLPHSMGLTSLDWATPHSMGLAIDKCYYDICTTCIYGLAYSTYYSKQDDHRILSEQGAPELEGVLVSQLATLRQG
jgi:hypothetical protein